MTKKMKIRECLNKNSVQGGLTFAEICRFSDGRVVCLTDM